MVESVSQSVSKEAQQQEGPVEAGPAVGTQDDALLGQLRRISELIAAQRLPEAESLLIEARRSRGTDLRLLKLLALVRFKLGRLAESREVYREAVVLAPDDPMVRLNLGLIALKLDDFTGAAQELESTVRLQPEDRRAWSYLGYAYAKRGAPAQAASAFRRAGQHELAAEMERATTPAAHAQEGVVEGAVEGAQVEGLPPARAPAGAAPDASSMATPRPVPREDDTPMPAGLPAEAPEEEAACLATLASFTSARLLSLAEGDVPLQDLGRGVLRFAAGAETHVRESALLVATGAATIAPARRRVRGHLSNQPLVEDGDRLLRVEARAGSLGKADLLIVSPDQQRRLVALSLDHDVLYIEASRAVAWGDDIVWETGSVPGNGTQLVQFRGSGRVVVLVGKDELVALRIAEGDPMTLPVARLAGWLGRVVVQATPGQPGDPATAHVTCEGEGVLLMSKHAESR